MFSLIKQETKYSHILYPAVFCLLALCLSLKGSMVFAAQAQAKARNNTNNPDTKETALIEQDAPVDLLSDRLEHDDRAKTVTAYGKVRLEQAGRVLQADRITYFIETDTVKATGNVVLTDVTGDKYFMEEMEVKDSMKNGFVSSLNAVLADGSRISAKSGRRIDGKKTILEDATYTPCEPCREDPSKPPVWQLVADRVTHDAEEKSISYRNARFELAGVPILYTPYFYHPDGSVDRKSGFLIPSMGLDSTLGVTYDQSYYWDIAPDKDATFGLMLSSRQVPVFSGQYRQRFSNASLQVGGRTTYSERKDLEAGRDKTVSNDFRGHIYARGLWDINEKWRAGLNMEATSDDQFLRQYNINANDILENELYVERFSGRNYASARVMDFHDTRITEGREQQPSIAPEIYASFMGAPNATLGGRWSVEISTLGLHREGKDQDMIRAGITTGWQRRYINSFGLVSSLDLMGRGDLYKVYDRFIARDDIGRSRETSKIRIFAMANLEESLPLVKDFEKLQAVVEPVASITIGSNVKFDNDIPNEDSQDVVVDASNLFEPDRFPGRDMIEDRQKITYGVRSGIYGHNGNRADIFIGQSHRVDSDDNPFPEGSGLSEESSDYVGQIRANLGQMLDLNYRFQLENTGFEARRHEVDMESQIGRLSFNTRYFYAGGLGGTSLDDSREQIHIGGTYRLNDKWNISSSAQYDLGRDKGLRRAGYGFEYLGQCMTLSASAVRTLTRESTGDSSTEVFLRIGLKNLGEIKTSGLNVGGGGNRREDTATESRN